MILQTVEPSSRQAATDQDIRTCATTQSAPPQAAVDDMRHQLYLLDRSERRMTVEESAAALLEGHGGRYSA